MRIARLAIAACGLIVLMTSPSGLVGCKDKAPKYKRNTPVETINSFRRALEAGRIPADTGTFFLSSKQKTSWKLRCKAKGCKRANFEILKVESEDEYAATYRVTYRVFGNGNRVVMQGTNTPMTFSLHDGAWLIDQLGVVHTIKLGPKKDAGPTGDSGGAKAASGDAAPAASTDANTTKAP